LGIRHQITESRPIGGWKCIFVLWAINPALATPAAASPAPSYYELLHQAEATAPRLMESHAYVGVAQGLADQAGALPNPTGGILFENFADRQTPLTGFSPQQMTISLSQPIEWGGKRGARIAAGEAELVAPKKSF
jgi:cobalt-zinc-cadmium efflux system outer membrane protein